jgi:hypothetical protein
MAYATARNFGLVAIGAIAAYLLFKYTPGGAWLIWCYGTSC